MTEARASRSFRTRQCVVWCVSCSFVVAVAVARIVRWPRGRRLASPAWVGVDLRVIPLGTVPACARGRSTTAVGW
jgi:hypothetical protein